MVRLVYGLKNRQGIRGFSHTAHVSACERELNATVNNVGRSPESSVAEITVIMPYYGYARQDRKSKPREPISARLVAELMEAAGADRVVAVDLHVPQIQGFFKVPVDNLTAMPLFADYVRREKLCCKMS